MTAMALGADGVEVDVRLSADGVLVCSHDPVVTTPLGRELVVSQTTASELLARAGADAGGRLATLPEVLSALADRGTSHVVVEAKPVVDQVAAFRTARALATLLVPLSTSMVATISSFDPLVLGAVRRTVFGTRLRTALLGHGHETESAVAVLRRANEAGHDEAHLSMGLLRQSPHAVRMAHHRGISVTAWTVNGAELEEVAALGVDAVITDDIATARTTVRQAAPVTPLALVGGTAC
jgi:glycerophosphoryl diester phosphodiesterase